MADEVAVGKLVQGLLQAGQSWLIQIAFIIQMEQQRQADFRARLVQLHVPWIVHGDSWLVLAKAFGASVEIALQHVDQALLAAAVGSSRIDRAKGNQAIAKGFG